MKIWRIFVVIMLLIIFSYFAKVSAQSPADVSIQSINFKSQQNTDVYPGSSNAVLRIDTRFNVNATNPTGNLLDLPAGFSPSSGYSTVSGARDLYGNSARNVTSGETVYFLFYLNVDKSTPPGTYYANFSVSYFSDSGVMVSDYFTIPLTVAPYPAPQISVSSSSWNPGGYPGTYGTSLQVTLENDGESNINSANVNLTLPSGFFIDNPQAQLSALNSGSRASITFSPIDISENVEPGSYTASLTVNAIMTTKDGVSYNSTFKVYFTVNVDPIPSKYKELGIFSAYWGDVRPQPVYSDSLYAQLNIVYINNGDNAINSIQTTISSPSITPILTSSVYYGSLQGGGSTTLNYYVSINSSSIMENILSFMANVSYRVDLGGGSYLVIRDNLPFNISIEKYPISSEGNAIGIVSWGWYNGYSVFPNTNGAILTVTIANKLPFSLSGANFTLLLPENFSVDPSTKEVNAGTAIQAYGTFSMQFKLNIGNVQPGNYTALLLAQFVINSGGPGISRIEVLSLNLKINDISESIKPIEWGWKEGSVDIVSFGANYYIILRNEKIDALTNPVLYIYLPQGIRFSQTNMSTGGVIPSSQGASSQVIPLQNIQQYLQQIAQSTSPGVSGTAPSSYSKGESIYFTFPLNIMVNVTGNYYAEASLSFIDVWGTLRSLNLTIPIPVYGAVNYIDVKIVGKLDIRSRYTNLTIEITNNGTSPAYNVYLTLSPPSSLLSSQATTSILLANPSTIYIPILEQRKTVSIPVTFVYNPFGSQSIVGTTAVINYGVVPLQISIQYRDAGGQQHTFNNQIALAVEPFIELSLTQVTTSLSNGTLKIGGTLINYGSQTAYRVNIIAYTSNLSSSYFIGDMDPASQSAFRIEVPVPSYVNKENVTLIITYYNTYNELYRREINFQVSAQPTETHTQITQTTGNILNNVEIRAAIVMIGAFLLFTAIIIYRMYSSHAKRMKGMKEE
jgi:hypothetical protein